MAVGQDASTSGTNPFDEPEEDDVLQFNTEPPAASSSFIRIPILIACTVVVFILLIAGTATTALSYPSKYPPSKYSPSKTNSNDEPVLDDRYKLLGPLLLTAGCFLLIVDVTLCVIMTREAYYSSRSIQPSFGTLNSDRPAPISLVSGPFFIATTDPAMAQRHILPFHFMQPNWVHPNAPFSESPFYGESMNKSHLRTNTATMSRNRQPSYNPDGPAEVPISGA